ncbi:MULTISPECIES: NYN domain-containing protein [Neisseriaceae]|uniref:NYN domain-containing protein n=1 Tax=Neisseriaceae TaxID=481 RepID=UPI0028ED1189|nr:NYN domain-containing protein [Neisseria bacilliformis]
MSRTKTNFNVVEEKAVRLAVLIDADNASARDIAAILDEVTKFGDATVKRTYGNFVGDNGQWKQVINDYAIKPMQQFAFTTGKNATDGFMIIDAMDLLYSDRLDGFCIVSSDSDFTALAIRLKEQGMPVYGFGRKQTPKAFINACTQFIYVENLISEEIKNDNKSSVPVQTDTAIQTEQPTANHQTAVLPMDTIRKIFEQFDSEWVTMAEFGSIWRRLQADFDPRNYGCDKLTTLVKNHPDVFEYEMRKNSEGKQENIYVKLKQA